MGKALLIALALALAGCAAEEHEDLKKWMRDSTKDFKGKVPPLPEVKPQPIVAYEAGGLTSPFDGRKIEPEKKASGGGGLQPDLNRRREPLESYPLESLRMVGTLSQGRQTIAIVQADRNVHHVRTGNHMGQNFGVITGITDSALSLKELVQDSSGDWIERTSTLQLQEK